MKRYGRGGSGQWGKCGWGRPVGSLLFGSCLLWAGSIGLAVAEDVAANAAGPTSELQEIIVTATRRAESVTQVPESIAVFDAASLDTKGIRSVQDLAEMAPGIDFSQTVGIETNISIRGISNTAGTAGQSATGAATLGIYLDDTPIQARGMGNGGGDPLPDIFDLARVEVLRGPQGTLFGSGSEGGAIRFISVEPSLQEWSSYGRAELEFTRNGGTSYDAGVAGGGPIIDGVLGFRVSAHDRHDGGFVNRVPYPDGAGPDTAEANSNYSDTVSARAALLWRPIESLRITPSLYVRQTNINDASNYWMAQSDLSEQRYVSGNGQNSPDSNRSSLASVAVNWNQGAVELISNTSYYSRNERNFSDYRYLITNTFSPAFGTDPFTVFATPGYYDNGVIDNKQNNWTQEVRLQSTRPDSRLSWVTGIFYQDARQLNYELNQTPYFDLEVGIPDAAQAIFGLPLIDNRDLYEEQIITHDKQLAGFGEVNFDLTSHLRLTAGLRVARTEIDFLDTRDGPLANGPGTDRGKHLETPKTPKYGVSYRFDRDNMLYASVANGFRIGGVNGQGANSAACQPDLAALGLAAAPKTYNSDKVRSYEIGAKLQPSERWRISASTYYIQWLNIIQPVDLVGCGQLFTTNLGRAVSKGADLELTWAPVHNVLLDLMVSYDNAKFTQTLREDGATSNIITAGWTLGQTPWTAVASGELKFRGPLGSDAYFRTDVDYHSSNGGVTANTDPQSAVYNPLLRLNPSTLDVKLRLGARLKGWDVSLFIDNATNNHPLLDLSNDAVDGPVVHALPVRPLTVGLTVQSRVNGAAQ